VGPGREVACVSTVCRLLPRAEDAGWKPALPAVQVVAICPVGRGSKSEVDVRLLRGPDAGGTPALPGVTSGEGGRCRLEAGAPGEGCGCDWLGSAPTGGKMPAGKRRSRRWRRLRLAWISPNGAEDYSPGRAKRCPGYGMHEVRSPEGATHPPCSRTPRSRLLAGRRRLCAGMAWTAGPYPIALPLSGAETMAFAFRRTAIARAVPET
jgi:hypothetical protein